MGVKIDEESIQVWITNKNNFKQENETMNGFWWGCTPQDKQEDIPAVTAKLSTSCNSIIIYPVKMFNILKTAKLVELLFFFRLTDRNKISKIWMGKLPLN